jgi:hypothetical protein
MVALTNCTAPLPPPILWLGTGEMGVSEDEFSKWLSPPEAVNLLASAYEGDHAAARLVLLRGLQGGLITAVAQSSTWEDSHNQTLLDEIQRDDWNDVTVQDLLWKTGHWNYSIQFRTGISARLPAQDVTVSRFGVRFEPQGVRALLLPATTTPAPEPQTAHLHEKRPPVSPNDLQAWYELYCRVYLGSADTEEMAMKSAVGMFPDKSVARDRIRALRGSRPMGRPKKR